MYSNPVVRSGILFGACFFPLFAQTNVLTYRNDNSRTAQNLSETTLNPSNVNSTAFGKLMSLAVDGKVDAQPLYVSGLTIGGSTHNVLFAVTEHDSVYAFDATSGAVLWHISTLKSGETPSDSRSCSQVTPEIGVTSTPVIDLHAGAHGTIYVVAMSKDSGGGYHQRLHALDLTTGAELLNGPTDVQATYPGTGDNSSNGNVVFDPKQYKDRTGILLVNGIVYTIWASHCDIRPYTGWVIAYDQNTLAQTGIVNFTPNGNEGAMWGAGGGAAADPSGNLFFQMGNGTFDTALNSGGFPSKGDYGNAFVKVTPAGHALNVADYWTMDNTVAESNADEDLGSGGMVLLPDLVDAQGNTRHLGTGAGKDKNVYVFDRDNMGKFNPSSNSNLYQELPGGLSGGAFSSPAYFNGYVYYGSVGDVIRAFKINSAKLSATPSSTSQHSFPYPGTSPSISANGNSGGILWAVENSSPAVLHAYDANDLVTELYNSNQAANNRDQFGNGNKYITPTIANGRVFVGTQNSVAVFGLLSATLGSLSPNTGAQGTNVNVTLTGTNFTPQSTLAASGSGITFTNVTYVSATDMTATFTIAATAGTGAHNVYVVSPSGNSNTLPFTVTAAGVGSPSLASVSPNNGTQGASVNVTLTGTNFVSGAKVNVSGTGVTASNISVVSSTQITATLTIAAAAATGTYNLSVTTSHGTSGAVAFTVNAAGAVPTLTAITPNSGSRGTSVNVTLTGTNFTPQTGVRLAGIGASFSNVVVVSSTKITVTFTLKTTTATGPHNVHVVTAAGSSNNLPFNVN